MHLTVLTTVFFDQLLTSPFLFQLQVANLLSNVFKLLMTHKVRSSRCLPSAAGSYLGRQKYWDHEGQSKWGAVTSEMNVKEGD